MSVIPGTEELLEGRGGGGEITTPDQAKRHVYPIL